MSQLSEGGSGVSDPVALGELTSLDLWMDDIHAVMDEAGSESAVFYGIGGGGTMAMLYAATHPERVSGLVSSTASPVSSGLTTIRGDARPSSRKRSWTSCAPGGGKEFSST
jgi:pimeloyl-ACP methyl ester carboxylesterase